MILERVQICQPTIVILIFMAIFSLLFNLKELYKRIIEQRRTDLFLLQLQLQNCLPSVL